jgi:hypothetical protein
MFRRNAEGKQDGAQIQVLSYLGEQWGTGKPTFRTEQVVEFGPKVAENGGAITWDTPTQRGGGFSQPFLEQLAPVSKALASR